MADSRSPPLESSSIHDRDSITASVTEDSAVDKVPSLPPEVWWCSPWMHFRPPVPIAAATAQRPPSQIVNSCSFWWFRHPLFLIEPRTGKLYQSAWKRERERGNDHAVNPGKQSHGSSSVMASGSLEWLERATMKRGKPTCMHCVKARNYRGRETPMADKQSGIHSTPSPGLLPSRDGQREGPERAVLLSPCPFFCSYYGKSWVVKRWSQNINVRI